jgi:hypothetical protein
MHHINHPELPSWAEAMARQGTKLYEKRVNKREES